MPFHGGLDWGGASHAVCVINGTGQAVVRIEVRHDAAGLADMLARLKRIAVPADLPIAIERPSGLIVDTLVQAGHPVIPIHPNVVKACRRVTAPLVAKAIRVTPTCWLTSCVPMDTVSARSWPPPTTSRRCAPWSVGAMTWWPNA